MRKTISRFLIPAVLLAPLPLYAGGHEHGHAHWAYEGHGGPGHWGELDAGFAVCKDGHAQSPVNIETSKAVAADLAPIQIDYKATPMDVVNNGHTIQVTYAPGSKITVGDKQYELLQFHFHAPSEHTINGKPADMVVHLVHKAADGHLGVIDVMMNKGADNAALATVLANLPAHEGEKSQPAGVTINAADLLPADKKYFAYNGSLTTPPCSEVVDWMVMATTTTVGEKQLAAYKKLFPMSARPTQPLFDRVVKVAR